jgi:glucose-1-phosphate cytidylyltransferase
MKAVILAGGHGTRISEESLLRPKPMIEIGTKPIIWHIMKMYSAHGINDFVICCGYKGYCIKEYFANYSLHMNDVTIDMVHNQVQVHQKKVEPWKITMIDTGIETMTGGRLLRIKSYIENNSFCMTYGDGVSDIDITALIKSHVENKKLATVTAVKPPGRFGAMSLKQNQVMGFEEKPKGDGAWINGGFFVLEPEVFDLIEDDKTVWEQKPLQTLANNGQLMAYKHDGFWSAMDTLRDKNHLEELWLNGSAPWKVWS